MTELVSIKSTEPIENGKPGPFTFHIPTSKEETNQGNTLNTDGRISISAHLRRHSRTVRVIGSVLLLLLYYTYFAYCMYHKFGDEGSWRLLIFTLFGTSYVTWSLLQSTSFKDTWINFKTQIKVVVLSGRFPIVFRWTLYVGMSAFIIVYLVMYVALTKAQNLISLSGIAVFLILLFLFSKDRKKVPWHSVFWGMALQFVFGLFVLKTNVGIFIVTWLGDRLREYLAYSNVGAEFVFGPTYAVHRLAFQTIPSVLFFCVTISVLVYLGVVQVLVRTLGGTLSFCLRTSAPESINVAANMFLGSAESCMLIYKYLPAMTDSQIFTILSGGLASCGGAALIVFMSFGVPAEYLLAASVMSAPATLAAAKLYFPDMTSPETEMKEMNDEEKDTKRPPDRNAFAEQPRTLMEAINSGIRQSLALVTVILSTMIIYLTIITFVNATLVWLGERAGVENVTFQFLSSYIMFPFAYVMGVAVDDCRKAGELLGTRTLLNPGVSYIELGQIIDNGKLYREYVSNVNNTWTVVDNGIFLDGLNRTLVGGVMDIRSEVIVTYALCGFASVPIVGGQIGLIGAIVPSKERLVSKQMPMALVVGTIASYLTACVADADQIKLGKTKSTTLGPAAVRITLD